MVSYVETTPAVQKSYGPRDRQFIYDAHRLRQEIEELIATYTSRFYRLVDEIGTTHFLVESRILLEMLDWFFDNPRLACTVYFVRKKMMRTSSRVSLSALSEAEVLSISRFIANELGVAIHFYDRSLETGYHRSRRVGAPLRDVNFDDLDGPYRGYCLGSPVSVISRKPINLPNTVKRRQALHQQDQSVIDVGPIDAVYTWVNSEDQKWQAKFLEFVGKHSTSSNANELRYLSRDELRYSIRSVLQHAPWIQNIYIVTDDQRPDWLRDTERVRVISHKDIFPDKSVLPVFNSHAIESCLHRIPGLAERFIYFNDDVFLGQDVGPEDFFGADGASKVFFSGHLSFNPAFIEHRPLSTDAAFRNTIKIIEAEFGYTPVAKVLHTPHPMLRSNLELIESQYPEQIAQTRSARTRSDTDLNVTGNLSYYYCLGQDKADFSARGSGFYKYIDTGRRLQFKALSELEENPTKFFCLNLTQYTEVSPADQFAEIQRVLKKLFPVSGEHEKGHHPLLEFAKHLTRLK